jgi:hypothetical protein
MAAPLPAAEYQRARPVNHGPTGCSEAAFAKFLVLFDPRHAARWCENLSIPNRSNPRGDPSKILTFNVS